MNDRRIYQRFDARYPAKYKDTRSDFGDNVMLRDACADGARIRCKDRLYLNDHVALEVELPDGRAPMTLRGRVIWVIKDDESCWDVGVQFHEVNFFGLSRLYKHVDFPSYK